MKSKTLITTTSSHADLDVNVRLGQNCHISAREVLEAHDAWPGPTEDLGIDVTVNPVVKGRGLEKAVTIVIANQTVS